MDKTRQAKLMQEMAAVMFGRQALDNIRLEAENVMLKEQIAALELTPDTPKDE